MKLNDNDKNKAGIYCITNTSNNKMYIGKSKNIYNRIREHIEGLRRKSTDENRHLIAAGHKYGETVFEYTVLEYLEFDEQLLAERELYGITTKNTIDRKIGYNLRLDSSTKMIVHEETRQLVSKQVSGEKNPNYQHYWSEEKKQQMSDLKKQQYKEGKVRYNPEGVKLALEARKKNGERDPSKKEQMIQKIRDRNTKYKIYQYTKNDELVKIGNCMNDIIIENPTYKKHNIYAVCSGEKPTIYGYKGKKVTDDIVQTSLKEDE